MRAQNPAGFEIFRGRDGQWYWRLRARNRRIVCVAGEGYVSKSNAQRSVDRVVDSFTTLALSRMEDY